LSHFGLSHFCRIFVTFLSHFVAFFGLSHLRHDTIITVRVNRPLPGRFVLCAHGVGEVGDVVDVVQPQERLQLDRKRGEVDAFFARGKLEPVKSKF
jgi:hypothetical protein